MTPEASRAESREKEKAKRDSVTSQADSVSVIGKLFSICQHIVSLARSFSLFLRFMILYLCNIANTHSSQ